MVGFDMLQWVRCSMRFGGQRWLRWPVTDSPSLIADFARSSVCQRLLSGEILRFQKEVHEDVLQLTNIISSDTQSHPNGNKPRPKLKPIGSFFELLSWEMATSTATSANRLRMMFAETCKNQPKQQQKDSQDLRWCFAGYQHLRVSLGTEWSRHARLSGPNRWLGNSLMTRLQGTIPPKKDYIPLYG